VGRAQAAPSLEGGYYVWWGALAGHVTALVIGLIAAMTPPKEWASSDRLRGLLGEFCTSVTVLRLGDRRYSVLDILNAWIDLASEPHA
jgi:hypothetical protein